MMLFEDFKKYINTLDSYSNLCLKYDFLRKTPASFFYVSRFRQLEYRLFQNFVGMYPRISMKITVLCQERPGSSSAKVASRATYFF